MLISAAVACLVLGVLGGVALGQSSDSGSTQTVTKRSVVTGQTTTTTISTPSSTVTDTDTVSGPGS